VFELRLPPDYRHVPPGTNAFPTGNLKTIEGPGKEKSTGINTNPDVKEQNGMRWKRESINQAGAGKGK